ncbi:MAG: Rv3235 family protein [Nitriliruptoraceae bacterium]
MSSNLPAHHRQPLTVRPAGDDPVRIAAMLVAAWSEVRTGQRPFAQLTPLLSPAARRRLAVQVPPRSPATRRRVRVHKVVARRPRPDACEAVVLVRRDARITAIAVRLERHLGHWRAVELTAPEAGLTALPTASLPAGHRCRDAFDEVGEEFDGRSASAG